MMQSQQAAAALFVALAIADLAAVIVVPIAYVRGPRQWEPARALEIGLLVGSAVAAFTLAFALTLIEPYGTARELVGSAQGIAGGASPGLPWSWVFISGLLGVFPLVIRRSRLRVALEVALGLCLTGLAILGAWSIGGFIVPSALLVTLAAVQASARHLAMRPPEDA